MDYGHNKMENKLRCKNFVSNEFSVTWVVSVDQYNLTDYRRQNWNKSFIFITCWPFTLQIMYLYRFLHFLHCIPLYKSWDKAEAMNVSRKGNVWNFSDLTGAGTFIITVFSVSCLYTKVQQHFFTKCFMI